ncbi:hypothetical protein D3C71_89370 [compost metagenome]
MKTSILSLAVALMLGFSFSANAGTPEVKAGKADAAAPKATAESTTTYYVLAQIGSNYTISSDPNDNPGCTQGTHACSFTSPDPALGSSISVSVVENEEDDIVIVERKP